MITSIQQTKPDIMARLLKIDKAYHSHHMSEVGPDYIRLMGDEVRGNAAAIPFFSSVHGRLASNETTFSPEYWRTNLESPVRFREAVEAILNHEIGKAAVFLEIGPHSALAGPLRQIFSHASSPTPYVSAMLRGQDCTVSFLAAIGKLHSLGIPIDLQSRFPNGTCLPDLPRYPWNHEESYWYESRVSKEHRQRRFPLHDLLGLRSSDSSELEPVFRNLLHLSNVPWVRDHKLGEDIVFPFAGYIALAGEAVRQITGTENGYHVRNVIVATAFVVSEGKPMEMVSTFKPQRLTNSLNCSWWEFTVSSHNGHAWVKHCTGEVAPVSSQPVSVIELAYLPRKINAKRYYETMRKGGLDLGPCFQTLEDIQTTTDSENRAIAKVLNGRQGDEQNYHIHPTTLDATIQIMGAGAVNGSLRKTRTWLPTSIDSLTVLRCSDDMKVDISATVSSNQSVVGNGRCFSNGSMVVEALGVKLALADGTLGVSALKDTHAAARYELAPHVAFKDPKGFNLSSSLSENILADLNELGQLCLLISQRLLSGLSTPSDKPHLARYQAWLLAQAHRVAVSLAPKHNDLQDAGIVLARIDSLVCQLSTTPAASMARVIRQTCSRMEELLSGVDLKDVLSETDWISAQAFIQPYCPADFIRCLGHTKPNLRVLELSTGTSPSPSEQVVEALRHANGEILCSRCTLTTASFTSAKDQNKAFANLEVQTLDIREDPDSQGFESQRYDLIVASDILRSSTDAQQRLGYPAKLLGPGGYLVLQQVGSSADWFGYVFGLRPDWCPPTSEEEETSRDVGEYKRYIAAAGLDLVPVDESAKNAVAFSLIARKPTPESVAPKSVAVLCDVPAGPNAMRIIEHLDIKGYRVTRCTLDGPAPDGEDVVSLLDADSPFFADMSKARYGALQAFLNTLNGTGML
jgi:acyl transferase domain-containing protein